MRPHPKATSPLRSPEKRRPDSVGSSGKTAAARFGYPSQESRLLKPNVGAAKAKIGSFGRSAVGVGRAGPKKKAREDLLAQDTRRTSVIHPGDDIGAELENGPERKKSMSRSGHQHSDDDDFDQFSEAEHDDATAPKGSLSSDSGGWTPSFAGRSEPPNTPQTADEEESRGPLKPIADGRRLPSRPPTVPLTGSGVQGLQDFFTDEEDSSPLAPKKSVPRIPLAPPKRPLRGEAKEQISKPKLPTSASQSFLSDSDSDAKSPPARSSTMPILMEEPIDLSTSPIQQESPIQPQSPLLPHSADLQLAPAQAQSREMRFPTKAEARPLQSSREDSPKCLVTLRPLPEVSLFVDAEATHPPPTPQFDVTGSSVASPELTPSPAASPAREKSFASPLSDASCGRIEDLGSSPSEAAATTTASLGVASRSIASNGSPRSPFSEETQDLSPSPLKRQLEELEEQQRQIQSSLTQALEYERRLRADEVARCHSLTAELLEALETERRRHSEDIRAWELRLQTQLNEHEAKWLSEVEALQAEVARLRAGPHAVEEEPPSAPPEKTGHEKEAPEEAAPPDEGPGSWILTGKLHGSGGSAGSTASSLSMCESLWQRPKMPSAPKEEAEATAAQVPVTFSRTDRLNQPASACSTLEAPGSLCQGREVSFGAQEAQHLPGPLIPATTPLVPQQSLPLATWAWQARDASPDRQGAARSFPAPVPVETPKGSARGASNSPASRLRFGDGSPAAKVLGGNSGLSPRSRIEAIYSWTPAQARALEEPVREGYTLGRSRLVPGGYAAPDRSPSSSPSQSARARLLSPPRAEQSQPTFFPSSPRAYPPVEANPNLTPALNFSLGRPQVTFEMPRNLAPW